MTPEEAVELLAQVRKMSERSRDLQEEMSLVASLRGDAIRAAMDAGIPRTEIAKAAGTSRQVLYQLTRKEQ